MTGTRNECQPRENKALSALKRTTDLQQRLELVSVMSSRMLRAGWRRISSSKPYGWRVGVGGRVSPEENQNLGVLVSFCWDNSM